MKKNRLKKGICLLLSITFLLPSTVPSFANSNKDYNTLNYNLDIENFDLNELKDLKKLIKSQLNINENQRGAKLGIAKSIAKFLIRNIDIIPNKAVREAIKKYGGKLINVIDTLDSYSWYGISSGLQAIGVPGRYANLFADILTYFIL